MGNDPFVDFLPTLHVPSGYKASHKSTYGFKKYGLPKHSKSAAHGRLRLNSLNPEQAL